MDPKTDQKDHLQHFLTGVQNADPILRDLAPDLLSVAQPQLSLDIHCRDATAVALILSC